MLVLEYLQGKMNESRLLARRIPILITKWIK